MVDLSDPALPAIAARPYATRSPASHWNEAYAAGDVAVSWTQVHPTRSLSAITAVAPDLAPAIIDVGGGSSALAGELIGRGHTDVTVLDVSTAGLSLARKRLGAQAARVQWIAADVLAWRPARRYAVWHDRAVLHFFTDPTDRARYAEALNLALAPGGYAIIAIFAPDGPARCSGLPVQRSSAQDILDLLGDQFTAVSAETERHRTPSGRDQAFTWLVAQRTRSAADSADQWASRPRRGAPINA